MMQNYPDNLTMDAVSIYEDMEDTLLSFQLLHMDISNALSDICEEMQRLETAIQEYKRKHLSPHTDCDSA
jgi:hypothetical protein